MDNIDAQYLFLLDVRSYVNAGKGKEILRDLKTYFPEEYDRLLADLKVVETDKKLAALLHASPS